MRSPMMSPKSPIMEPKISMTRTLTKSWASAASATAQVAPVIPTQTPQAKLATPTVSPAQKSAYPGYMCDLPFVNCIQEKRTREISVFGPNEDLVWGRHTSLEFWREHNGNNEPVNCYNFTKNNGNQVFGADSWGLDGGSEERRASDVDSPEALTSEQIHITLKKDDTPSGTNDRESNGQGTAKEGPHVRRRPC